MLLLVVVCRCSWVGCGLVLWLLCCRFVRVRLLVGCLCDLVLILFVGLWFVFALCIAWDSGFCVLCFVFGFGLGWWFDCLRLVTVVLWFGLCVGGFGCLIVGWTVGLLAWFVVWVGFVWWVAASTFFCLDAVGFWVFAVCDCDCSWCAVVTLLDCGLGFCLGVLRCGCS